VKYTAVLFTDAGTRVLATHTGWRGVVELTGGIHRVDGVRGANCYFVPGADGLYLVDTCPIMHCEC
jgi:hypothetical protein